MVKIYCHQVPEVRKLEREAWYGGRCDAWQLGVIKEPVLHLDVKTQYAFIASKEEFPTRLVDYGVLPNSCIEQTDVYAIHDLIKQGYHVIAKVRVCTDKPSLPLRHEKLTIFPTGRFITTLASPELKFALENGLVESVLQYAVYETQKIFVENSKWFFEARKRLKELGLEDMSGPLKLAQNSMYGNIGRRGRKWIECPKVTDLKWGESIGRNPVTGEPCLRRIVYGVHQYLDLSGEPDTSCPAISATIFSYSRMQMWEYLCKADIENCFYDDTDGLQVNRRGALRLNYEEDESCIKPGDLTLREFTPDWNQTLKDIDIRGIKHYRFGDTWRQAGVPSNAERDEFGNVKFDIHTSFDMGLWHKTPLIHSYDQRKIKWNEIYKHGHVLESGRTVPFVMDIVTDEKTGEERNVIR
jgi:hypothetical protein